METSAIVSDEEQARWDAWVLEIMSPRFFEETEPADAVEPETKTVAETQSEQLDRAFSAIVDEMAVRFTKDAEALAAKTEEARARAALAAIPKDEPDFESWEFAEDDAGEIGYAPNRDGEHLENRKSGNGPADATRGPLLSEDMPELRRTVRRPRGTRDPRGGQAARLPASCTAPRSSRSNALKLDPFKALISIIRPRPSAQSWPRVAFFFFEEPKTTGTVAVGFPDGSGSYRLWSSGFFP